MAKRSAVSEYLAKIGRKGGLAAGAARMQNLTAAERRRIAKLAARARWAKAKGK